ncbi:MAG: TonB-dependent receptor [Verrucomicrobia bacterium]|nr:TonB-dependent receptor [Verrucomicrobiota bacterium]
MSHIARLESQTGVGEKWGFSFGATFKDFGDIRDRAVGIMDRTGYPEQNYDFKFEWQASPNTQIAVAHQYLNQDEIWRWHSTIFNDVGWNGAATGNFRARIYDQERSLTYLKAEGELDSRFVQSWKATISFQNSQDSEFQDRGPTDQRTNLVEVDTYGLDFQWHSALAGGRLLTGIDYYEDHIDSAGSRNGRDPRSQRPLADNSIYRLSGLFGQYQRTFYEDFELALGSRYTHADVDLGALWDATSASDLSTGHSWESVVLNVRGGYTVTRDWHLYGGASQGFRAPNVDDLSGNITSRSGLSSLGSLDLSPEKSITYELGSRFTHSRLDMGAAAFHTRVEDLITSVPVANGSGTIVSLNGDKARINGIEFDGNWIIVNGWSLNGFMTWQEGKSQTPVFLGGPEIDQWVSRLSPLRGGFALRYGSHASEMVDRRPGYYVRGRGQTQQY